MTTITGLTPIPMTGGRCWQFEHNTVTYQVVNLNGSEQVRLYFDFAGSWVYRLTRLTYGRSAKSVADEIRKYVADS